MTAILVALFLLSFVGLATLGWLLAHWLDWAEQISAELPPPTEQEPDLYHRLMRALIEGPED